MKKLLIISLFTLSLTCFPTYASSTTLPIDAKSGIAIPYTPSEGSIEELYKDIIVTLIYPYISEEIAKNYGRPLPFDLYDIEFLDIQRPNYRSFTFFIKLQVKPFVGAHNTIGIDEITIRISPLTQEGDPQIIDYKHIESFPPPPHLQEFYKDLKL